MQKERLFTNRQLLTLLWPLISEHGGYRYGIVSG